MKKCLLFLVCFFGFTNILNAECNYTEIKNLNILAGYVDTSYSYDDASQKFVLTILNVPAKLSVIYNNQIYNSTNNEVSLFGFSEGESVSINIKGSSLSECNNEPLRVINFTFPYLNRYYNLEACVGHESLDVCSHKFLNYKLSEETFNKLIKNDFDKIIDEKDDKIDENINDKEEKVSLWSRIVKELKSLGIPVLLVIVSSALTISICSVIYRKIKHGL